MNYKDKIEKAFYEMNIDAKNKWEDEKVLTLLNYQDKGEQIFFTVGIGRWNTTYHDLCYDYETNIVEIKNENSQNALIEDVIQYVLTPIFSSCLGRPPKSGETRKPITFRLTPTAISHIRYVATNMNMSQSDFIEHLVRVNLNAMRDLAKDLGCSQSDIVEKFFADSGDE